MTYEAYKMFPYLPRPFFYKINTAVWKAFSLDKRTKWLGVTIWVILGKQNNLKWTRRR